MHDLIALASVGDWAVVFAISLAAVLVTWTVLRSFSRPKRTNGGSMTEIEKTSCDFIVERESVERGAWSVERGACSVVEFGDPDRPRRARPQTVRIDLEQHADYLETP